MGATYYSVIYAAILCIVAMPEAMAQGPASIALSVELHQGVDMDCIASAAGHVPGVASLARSAPSELYVASPDETKVDKFAYQAAGFGGTLTFAPSFLGNSLYFRHTVDFPDGPPPAARLAEIRGFMHLVDRTLGANCGIPDLARTDEHCVGPSCAEK